MATWILVTFNAIGLQFLINLAPGEEGDCDPDAEREEGEGDDDGEDAAVGPAARAVELEVREVRGEPRLAERLNLQSKEVFEESV